MQKSQTVPALSVIALSLLAGTAADAQLSKRRQPDRVVETRTETRTYTVTEVVERIEVYEEKAEIDFVPVIWVENKVRERGDGARAFIRDKLDAMTAALEDEILEVGLSTKNVYDVYDTEDFDEQDLLSTLQFLEGDCMIHLSVTRWSTRDRQGRATEYTLDMKARVVDPENGRALVNIPLPRLRHTEPGAPEPDYWFDELYAKAMEEVVGGVGMTMDKLIEKLEKVEAQPSPKIAIFPTVSDISFPVFRENPENNAVFPTGEVAGITPTVTVKIGSTTIGTAPGTFDLAKIGGLTAGPRLVTIESTSGQFKPFREKVWIHDGMTLDIALSLTDEARAEFQQQMRVMNELRDTRTLTDAEAERLKGVAQYFRQSGYSIDLKSDININKNVNADVDIDIDSAASVQDLLESQLKEGEMLTNDEFRAVRQEKAAALEASVEFDPEAKSKEEMTPEMLRAAPPFIPMNA